ncbi:MAG: SGNH/GDSL hydrolase family protein [Flavobacteriales bacterium]|nr:SGNH/GDSL hydrolase family protein [Flavobacteriales bacterium]
MRLLLLGLILGIAMPSCEQSVEGSLPMTSYRYLALGDSYTIGQGVEYEARWPGQLVDSLAARGFTVDSLKYIAQTGWTTTDLQNAIDNSLPLEDFDMVSLLIGVNNQFQSIPFEVYEQEFDSLLSQAIAFAGGSDQVFVVSIPDYGVTPFGSGNAQQIGEQIDMYNAYALQVCTDRGIPFIDITTISRQLGDGPDALAPDNLHPSRFQYSLWVEEVLPVVEVILGK